MTKTIKGDLILKKDTTFDEALKVEGNIKGYFDLKVVGNLDCCNLNCRNLDCWNLDCRNLDCWNVVCCDKIKVKKGCKVKCKFLIKNRFSVEQKEWKIEEKRRANENR